MYINEINGDTELSSAAAAFYAACSTNASALSLTPAMLTEISTSLTTYQNALGTATLAKEQAKSSVDDKDIKKKSFRAVIAKYARTFHANQAIPDNLLTLLQLPPHNPDRTVTPPNVPQSLTAKVTVEGLLTLSWKRNGNISGTVFVIETQTAPGGAWTQVGIATGAKYETEVVLGQYISFRVIAARKKLRSVASMPIVLWSGDGTGVPELRLAA